MVIVHRLGSGGARYYLAAVAPDGGEAPVLGEAPGRWAGRASPGGPVEARALASCMPEGRGRLPGLDVMFAAPKSVSVLQALGGADVAAAVRAAHDAAVAAGLAYLERHACRVNERGRVVAADGFVAAAFRHRTSRADDPHLHTHVVVANFATGPDGRGRALHTPTIYAERRGAAATYHLVLRAALTSSVGVRWEVPVMGRADAVDVPGAVRAAFSRRRAAVLEESGSPGDRRWAEHATRPARDGLVDYASMQFGWGRRAASLGWSAPAPMVGRAVAVPPAGEDLLPADDRWSRADLMVALANHWRDGAPAADVRAAAERLLTSREVVATASFFTTRVAGARAVAVATALSERRLVPSGPDAVDALQRDGRRVLLVVRDPETAALAAARAGAPAAAVADATRAVAALEPGDVAILPAAQRLPSADVQRVLEAAAARGVEVVRGDPTEPSAAREPRQAWPTAYEAPSRTIAVPGGDITAAASPAAATATALGDWLARRRTGAAAVLVAERAEVDALNLRARAALRGAGLLGAAEVGGFAVGDVVQFTRARPSIGVARHAQGAVVSVAAGAVEVGLMGDGRRVLLRAGEMRSVGYAHVVPPLTALIAGRGDVFVVGGRTFAARHLGGARLHRYVTGPHALSRLLPPHTPGVDRTPELSLARHAAGRGTGRSR